MFYFYAARTRHSKNLFEFNFENSPSMDDFGSGKNSDLPLFDLIDIAAATENFSDANKLGQGGFGSVYKVYVMLSL